MARRQVTRQPARRGRQWVRSYDTSTSIDDVSGTFSVAPLATYEVAGTEKLEAGTTISRIKMDLVVTRSVGVVDTFPSLIGGLIVGPRALDSPDLAPAIVDGSQQAQMGWMWWRKLYVGRDIDSVPDIDTRSHYEVDVQAQRIVKSTAETLWLAFQIPTGATDTYLVSWGISVLLLLP